MPGTIVVSVLDVDLPTTSQSKPVEGGSNPDSVSLKVSMGKREYLTKGRADFSFPVLSLRENLIIALQEADGSEISRTDIKTMSVVEKSLLDSWFSFDGGGTAHLKLQFIVSSEEQKRIKEMREAALKRKQAKLFEIEVNKRALTVLQKVNQASRPLQKSPERREELATPLQREVPELQNRNTFKAPFTAPDIHEIDRASKVSLNRETLETPSSNLDIRRINQPSQDSQTRVTVRLSPEIHKISQPPEVPRVKFGLPTTTSVRRKVVTTLPSSSFRLEDVEKILTSKKKETGEISACNVKKMINAFETSLSQDKTELRPHNGSISSHLKKIESAGSFTEISQRNDTSEKVQADEIMVRSFSAGMLSEMNLEQSEQYKTPNKREQDGEYNFAINQNARDLDFNQSVVCDRMIVADQPTKSSEAVNFGASEIDIEPCKLAGTVEDFRRVNRPIICDRVTDARHCRQRIENPQLINLGATEGDSESYILSRDEQRHKALDESYRKDTTESSICRTCNLVRDIVPEACHPGYPELWIKRHLCITTATQQSVDLIGGFDIPAGPCSTDNELTEHMEQGDSSARVNQIKNISRPEKPNHERYPGIPSFNGKLLEQVVQFAVVAVACGVLVLRNR